MKNHLPGPVINAAPAWFFSVDSIKIKVVGFRNGRETAVQAKARNASHQKKEAAAFARFLFAILFRFEGRRGQDHELVRPRGENGGRRLQDGNRLHGPSALPGRRPPDGAQGRAPVSGEGDERGVILQGHVGLDFWVALMMLM